MSSVTQFPRAASLILTKGSSQGIDLSNMHFSFQVSNADTESPNTANIRVFNLNDQTQKQVVEEYDSVILQAGYKENIGIIFRGTIKQFHRGKKSNVDTYLDILAADGDVGYNFGFINETIAAGCSPQQKLQKCADAMGFKVDKEAFSQLTGTGGVILNPRSKAMFGMPRAIMRDLMSTHGARWSIQNGVVTVTSLTGYLPGEVVKINSATGMIGIPESTDHGILVQTLLNPRIEIGAQIQINNKDLTQTIIRDRFFPGYKDITFTADVTRDGFYRVLVAEHVGDTRSEEWFTNIVCLNLDPSAPVVNAVLPFG